MPPKVGIPQALTYHYRSVRILERFLREAGVEVVRSPRTTPEILSAATTLGSADFCLSLRLLIGHVHYLITQHPDLDFLLVPHLCSEDGEATTTCSKYRDAGGVALRSLGSVLGYLVQHADDGSRRAIHRVLARAGAPPPAASRFPVLLQPRIWSLEREPMFHTCFGVYCDVFGLSALRRTGAMLLPRRLAPHLAPHLERCRRPFDAAYDAVMRVDPTRLDRLLADPQPVRVALVGRQYLLSEPLLTADLVAWFRKAGARVITPADVRLEDLEPGPSGSMAFYDTHRLFEAFVERVAPHVDGFVFAGSFGCHPDAFILELLVDRARQKGVPAWLLRYDELAGAAGFQTRYETILRFLEQRRDRRLAAAREGGPETPPEAPGLRAAASGTSQARASDGDDGCVPRVPLFIWPFMSDHVELIMDEVITQAGLTRYVLPPRPVTEVSLALGAETFTESCCPYAFSTGSLIESLQAYFRAHPDGPPRRIVALTARGEGPCSFGLYILGQARDLKSLFGHVLERGRHTLEFVSIGLSDVVTFMRELAELGDRGRLAPIVDYLRMAADGTLDRLSAWRRLIAGRRLWATLARLLAPARAKLAALEEIRAQALLIRAHEATRGATSDVYRRVVCRLREAHTLAEIRRVRDQGLTELAAIPRDETPKPRVAVVGEIYVVQAPFANRGVIDTLLAQHGIEVTEGTTLGALVAALERDLRRRAWVRARPVGAILRALWRRGLLLFQETVEGVAARPFMNIGVGGEGHLTVAHARRLLEQGVDGVVHLMPFKCMPEGIAKAALAELCRLFGVPYLPLSFNRELEIERLRTEIATFAALLHARVGQLAAGGDDAYLRARAREIARRRELSRALNALHHRVRRHRYAVA
jgi:predicted nucleotide-binding protein (sugar kinase/HSP70/actin superfamily)